MSETENPPKAPIRYKFYCKICGKEFRAGKKHAQTCSASCRVALSNIMRYSVDPKDEDLTPDERLLADAKTEHAKGANVDISGDKRPLHKRMMGKDDKSAPIGDNSSDTSKASPDAGKKDLDTNETPDPTKDNSMPKSDNSPTDGRAKKSVKK